MTSVRSILNKLIGSRDTRVQRRYIGQTEPWKMALDSDWRDHKDILECNKYMLEHQINTDITFQTTTDDGAQNRWSAHRYMLVARSPVFSAMLMGPLAERGEIIKLTDIGMESFKQLLRFIYYEDVDLNFENVFTTLYAAKKYMLLALTDKCLKHIEQSLNPDNICTVLDQSILLDEHIEQKCMDIIQRSTKNVLRSESFTKISNYTLAKILHLNGFSVPEVDIFRACAKWAEVECSLQEVEATPANMREMLGQTLYMVHIPSLSLEEFSKVVVPSKLLDVNEENSVFRYITGDVDVTSTSFPFPLTKRQFVCYKCYVHHDGFLQRNTRDSPLYHSLISRSRWSLAIACDHHIRLHEIGFSGEFRGKISIFQNGGKLYEISSDSRCQSFCIDDEVLVEAGQFTIFIDSSFEFTGDYYYKHSKLPELETNHDFISFIPKECGTMSFLSYLSYTPTDEMFFVEDHFCCKEEEQQEGEVSEP